MNPLTAVHRAQQIATSAGAVNDLLGVWRMFDPSNIDESWPPVAQAALSIIGDRRSQSAALSSSYYQTLRELSGVRSLLPKVALATTGWKEAALISLTVTGPVSAKAAILAKRSLGEIAESTFVRVAGALSRHSLDGGRLTLQDYLRKDRVRYRRVTSGDPCSFCRLLASRGAAYVQATSHFRSHDHCHCTAEPVFR